MAGKDDRDVLVPKHRAASQPGEGFDDDTPIGGDVLTRTESRARSAARNSKDAVALISKAEERLRAEIRSYAETDQADHREMKGILAKQDLVLRDQDEKLDAHNLKLDTMNSHVSDLREGYGKVAGTLDVLVESFRTGQVLQRVEAETTAQVVRQTTTYKLKRKLIGWRLIAKIFGAIASVVGVGIAGHYVAKWFGA